MTHQTDHAAGVARATARRLTNTHGLNLPADVEAALHTRTPRAPDQYTDPVSVASLIVSIATLAWTIYTDLKKNTAAPPPEVIARAVRVQLRSNGQALPADAGHIIDIVAEETTQPAQSPADAE